MKNTKRFVRISFFLLFIILSLILSPVKAHAMTSISSDKEDGSVTIESNEIIDDNVAITGNNISIRGTINNNLFVAGANIKIEGEIKGTLFAAGNVITVSGKIGQDAFLGANTVIIEENAQINNDVFAGANTVSIDGKINRNLWIGANQLTINNIINGNVRAGISNLSITDNGKINGKLTYTNQKEMSIPNSSSILGGVEYKKISQDTPKNRKTKLVTWFIGLLQFLFVGLILALIMPKWLENINNTIKEKPWNCLGIGFIIAFIAPILIILLLISIIGAPFAFILLGIYLILLYLAKFWVAYYIGNLINNKWSALLKILLGIIILQTLFIIPFIAFLSKIIVLLIGLGSLYYIKLFKSAK